MVEKSALVVREGAMLVGVWVHDSTPAAVEHGTRLALADGDTNDRDAIYHGFLCHGYYDFVNAEGEKVTLETTDAFVEG